MKLELTKQFSEVFSKMENTSEHLFITGRAGTGKSTLLTYFSKNTKKNIARVAPTGVAALNINGMTIHNFFGFSITTTVESVRKKRYENDDDRRKVIESLETLVIDEVSMVRADLFDCINEVLKNNGPHKGELFGGVQMILIGDLYQLPPVVSRKDKEVFEEFYRSPYFFSSKVFNEIELEVLELTKIYRQKNVEFVNLLNKVRNNTINYRELELINKSLDINAEIVDGSICLTTTNAQVEFINKEKLERLDSHLYRVKALIQGNVPKEYYPAPLILEYKKEAQVMMIRNSKKVVSDEDENLVDSFSYVNGSLGKIEKIIKEEHSNDTVMVRIFETNECVKVTPIKWDIIEFTIVKGRIEPVVIGSFTQYPFILAWAVTIHKSQGKTFDKVLIDLGRGAFTEGQTYVALSRSTSLEGITLKGKIKLSDIKTDETINRFFARWAYKKSERVISMQEKVDFLQKAISDGQEVQINYINYRNDEFDFVITPKKVYESELNGHSFTALDVYNHSLQEDKTYIIEHIIALRIL